MANTFGTIEAVEFDTQQSHQIVTISGVKYITYADPEKFVLRKGFRAEFRPYRCRPLFAKGRQRRHAVIYSVRRPVDGDRYIICTDSEACKLKKSNEGPPYIIYDAELGHFIAKSRTRWWIVALAIKAYARRLKR